MEHASEPNRDPRIACVRTADKIVVLDEGRVVTQGDHEELLHSSPLYQRLCARLVDPDATIQPAQLFAS